MFRKVRINVITRGGLKTDLRAIRDENNNLIAYAHKRSMVVYAHECINGYNECAEFIERFERISNGKDAILWRDFEIDEYYISY